VFVTCAGGVDIVRPGSSQLGMLLYLSPCCSQVDVPQAARSQIFPRFRWVLSCRQARNALRKSPMTSANPGRKILSRTASSRIEWPCQSGLTSRRRLIINSCPGLTENLRGPPARFSRGVLASGVWTQISYGPSRSRKVTGGKAPSPTPHATARTAWAVRDRLLP
jgi:hypothetical protein